ncbi:DUF1345 domain-containing protein [Acidothermaceae bacterium B102]|nr:DUF1345 domain-containing protein [Acidothermaceae bacterium B102]
MVKDTTQPHRLGATATRRLMVATVVGVAVGLVLSVPFTWRIGLLCGWDAAALVLLLGLWPVIWPMDGDETAAHAVREDPSKPVADVLIIVASIASLAGVALVIVGGKQQGANQDLSVFVAVFSVLVSWTLVHSNYATRYARLYYSGPDGGIDFKMDDKPKYADFAYVAFTLGMTYQVADTDLQSQVIRSTVLRHALISYVFGAVIIAATINLVAGLSA